MHRLATGIKILFWALAFYLALWALLEWFTEEFVFDP